MAIARTLRTLQGMPFSANDLKANNVMLDKDDGVHIIDFGGASWCRRAATARRKRCGKRAAVDEEASMVGGGARRDYNTGTDMLMLLSFTTPALTNGAYTRPTARIPATCVVHRLLAPLELESEILEWRDMYKDIASRIGPATLKSSRLTLFSISWGRRHSRKASPKEDVVEAQVGIPEGFAEATLWPEVLVSQVFEGKSSKRKSSISRSVDRIGGMVGRTIDGRSKVGGMGGEKKGLRSKAMSRSSRSRRRGRPAQVVKQVVEEKGPCQSNGRRSMAGGVGAEK